MSTGDCSTDCSIYYLITGVVDIAVMVVALLPLLLLRWKMTGPKGDSSINHEMTPVSNNEDNLIYREIAFSNDKRTKELKEKNAEEDVTYAQIKNASHQDEGVTYDDVMFNVKGKQSDKPNKSTMNATYAVVKPLSHQPPPQDGITDLYACINKNKKTAKA